MAKDWYFVNYDDFPYDELMFYEEQLYNLELLGDDYDPAGRRRRELLEAERKIIDRYYDRSESQDYTS